MAKNRLTRWAWPLGICAGLSVWGGLYCTRSSSRASVEQFKAELKAKGEKLTPSELLDTNRPSSTKSCAFLLAALKRPGRNPGISSRFGTELMKPAGPGEAYVVLFGNWPEEMWAELREQVRCAEDGLRLLREGLKDPPRDFRVGVNVELIPMRALVAERTAAYWLTGAVLSEMREGNHDAALDNMEALAGLARMNQDDLNMVSQGVRGGIAELGLGLVWDILIDSSLNEPELARLQSLWSEVSFIPNFERAMEGGRTRMIQRFEELREFGPAAIPSSSAAEKYFKFPLYRLTGFYHDQRRALEATQETLEALRLVQAGRPWTEASERLSRRARWAFEPRGLSERVRYQTSVAVVQNLTVSAIRAVRLETLRQLTVTAIALKRYRSRHGVLPAKLESLVPELLQSAPRDPFGDGLLRYQAIDPRGLRLYSVGENGCDDGGDAYRSNLSDHWELESPLDLVWPEPRTNSVVPSTR